MIVKLTSTGLKSINESLNEASDNSDIFVWDGESEVPKDVVNVKIQDGVKEIGEYAFLECNNLISVTIPDSVTSIGSYAFSDCSNLTNVSIPNSVTSIDNGAFSDCTSITSINIPDGVNSISSSTFYGCSSLKSIIIPNSVTSIGYWAFSGCSSLTSITIPDSVTEIKVGAFNKCENLKSINLSNIIKIINANTFAYCDSLTSITIPDSVTEIDEYAFFKCSNLENIKLPKGVKLSKDAFKGCDKLKNLSNTINTNDNNNDDIVKLFIAKCLHTKVDNIVELDLCSDDETVNDEDLFNDWFLDNCNPKNVSIPDNIDEITMELDLDLSSYKNIKFARAIFYSDTASYLFFKNYDDANKFIDAMTEEFGESSNSDFEFYATSDDIILSDNIEGIAISDDF